VRLGRNGDTPEGTASPEAHFVSKLTDCDGENSEMDTSLDFAQERGYLSQALAPECNHMSWR